MPRTLSAEVRQDTSGQEYHDSLLPMFTYLALGLNMSPLLLLPLEYEMERYRKRLWTKGLGLKWKWMRRRRYWNDPLRSNDLYIQSPNNYYERFKFTPKVGVHPKQ